MTELQSLPQEREQLIKALQLVQKKDGYVSRKAIREIADYFEISPVEVEGVLSFYTQFRIRKPAQYEVAVCDGTACHIKGSSLVLNWLREEIKLNPGEIDDSGLFSLETVACLGCCSLAPVVSINGKIYGNLDRKSLIEIINKYRQNELAVSEESGE